jgi:hypothetical protein
MIDINESLLQTLMNNTNNDSPIRIATLVIVIFLIIGIWAYWLFNNGDEEVTPSPIAQTDTTLEAPTQNPITTVPLQPELPELDASDTLIRNLAASLSSHPNLALWLATDELIRRFTVVVDNIAENRNPSQHIMFMKPNVPFSVIKRNGITTINHESYQRYNTHTQIIQSIDTQGTAKLYLMLEPLINEAYVELGYPDTRFRNTLERAVKNLLDTPSFDTPPEVELRVSFYEYSDDALESLTPAQKQFLGIGPLNMSIVQTKLFEINRAIKTLTEQ